MRSIRTSLLIYLLPLLAVAVGLSLFLFYENQKERDAQLYADVKASLTENMERDRQLQEKRYDADRKAIEAYFNETLRLNANALAREVTKSVVDRRLDRRFACLNVLGFSDLLHGMPASPLMLVQRDNTTINYISLMLFFQDPALNFKLFEGILSSRDVHEEFYQVTDQSGTVFLRSKSLKAGPDRAVDESLPTPPLAWSQELREPTIEDVVLSNGQKVRLVTIKTPVIQTQDTWSRGPSRPGARPGGPFEPPTFIEKNAKAVVLLHYARPLTQLEQIHADFKNSLNAARKEAEQNSEEVLAAQARASELSLQSLRNWFIGITAATVLAAILGVIGLVHLSFRPVKRITEAVSRINERDFELRLRVEEVPSELAPIVGKLKHSLKSLEDAFTREKQAAADISHELRTPIAAMLATAQVCLRKQRSSEEYKEALGNCVEIGKQLQMLVERLLTLARIDAGSDPIRPERVDVPELANQCVNMVKPLAESRGLQLTMERNGPAESKTDPNKLREIVINLLHNAIEYNKPNGSIGVAVHRNNGHVHLEVHDTGVGISDTAKPRLFERFYRADPSRQADTVHAGLGLSIVKGYVDLMGGSIEVDSVEGEGSTFRVILPAESVN